jgi:cytochrome c peroxidase
VCLLAPLALAACEAERGDLTSDAGDGSPPGAFDWHLPPGFPRPVVPEDNPMSTAKVELGRHLFYDTRLSGNQTFSCASCHKQALAFTDGRKTGLGSTGAMHPRNTMGIINVAYATSLTWANPSFAMGVIAEPLERQSELPMYGDSPVELGLESQSQIEDRLRPADEYRALFAAAFPDDAEPISATNISRGLATFERVLISGNSAFDRYLLDEDESAFSAGARRGYELFLGQKLRCFHCHSGFNLSDHVHYEGEPEIDLRYHNTGLYNIDDNGAYPEPNTGVYAVTQNPKDMGFFKAPTLRNVAITAPYMHDGSIATLSQVLDHYAAGGRTISEGPYKGIGKDNPRKDKLVSGFELSDDERADVIAFLESLTDPEFLTNPAFADPRTWTSTP